MADCRLDRLGGDARAEAPYRLLPVRVAPTAAPRREVAAPALVERRHLGEPRGRACARPGAHATPTAFGVIARDGDSIGDVDTMDGVLELADAAPPGQYRIDKWKS